MPPSLRSGILSDTQHMRPSGFIAWSSATPSPSGLGERTTLKGLLFCVISPALRSGIVPSARRAQGARQNDRHKCRGLKAPESWHLLVEHRALDRTTGIHAEVLKLQNRAVYSSSVKPLDIATDTEWRACRSSPFWSSATTPSPSRRCCRGCRRPCSPGRTPRWRPGPRRPAARSGRGAAGSGGRIR